MGPIWNKVFYVYLRFDLNENSVSVWRSWHRTAYAVCVQWILSKMALRWRGGDELLNKVLCVQKVFSSLHNIQIEPLMDYSDYVFHTFLGLDSVIYLAVNGTVTSLPVFIWNILNCVPKTNKAFTGLERHGGKVINATIFFLGWSNPCLINWNHETYNIKQQFIKS